MTVIKAEELNQIPCEIRYNKNITKYYSQCFKAKRHRTMKIYQSLIDRLKTQHQSIDNIISSTRTDRLLTRPQPGKWNILDNIAHLASYQPVFIERVNQILVTEKPSFDRYIADVDPAFEQCRSLNIDRLIYQLNTDRKNLFDLIMSRSDQELGRIGTHKKFGPLNVIEWTEFFLLHEAHHIFTIFQIAHNTELS